MYAIKGENNETYYKHLNAVLDIKPHMTMDDGCDLVSTLHKTRTELLPGILGGTEETTTGVIRLRAMAAEGALKFPVVAVNDAMTKHLFDTAMAPVNPRLMASFAPPMCCWPARTSSWPATVGAAAGLPAAPVAWART